MSDRRTADALRTSTLPAAVTAVPTSYAVPRLADFGRSERAWRLTPSMLSLLVQALEATLALALMQAIAPNVPSVPSQYRTMIEDLWAIAAAIAVPFVLQRFKLYTKAALVRPRSSLVKLSTGLALVFVGVSLLVAVAAHGPSLASLSLAFASLLVTVAALRAALSRLVIKLSRANRLSRRAVIYGTGEDCRKLIVALEADEASDVRIAAVFDERCEQRSSDNVMGYPKQGGLPQMIAFCRASPVDIIILALPMQAEPRVLALLEHIAELPCTIKLASMSSKLRFCHRSYSDVGGVPLMDLAEAPICGSGRLAKALLDFVLACVALIVLSPLMASVALAIKLTSKGPVIFRQKRYGFNNELIEVWKFRSMYIEQSDACADKLVTKADPRVTPVGRILRKTSIDELPQLFNVLFGTLSLVGPRPHALAAKAAGRPYEQVVAHYFARHKVKPGITGWAQINGWRGETQTVDQIENRVDHDLHYIEHWSLGLDLYILLMTPIALLDTSHAY